MRTQGRVVLTMALLLAAAAAGAQEDEDYVAGVSVGYSTRFERALVAVDFLVHVSRALTVVPNVSYADVAGTRRWTGGVELQWNAPAHRVHRRLMAWAGAGMGVLVEDPRGPLERTTRDLLANAVVGVGYDAPAAPFVQVRVALEGPADVALQVGVRF
jgi:hypothetical protein